MNKKALYWICQIGGWLLFILIMSFIIKISEQMIKNYDNSVALEDFRTKHLLLEMSLYFVFGIVTTHIYRWLIVRFNWLKANTLRIISYVIMGSVLCSMVFHLLNSTTLSIFYSQKIFRMPWLIYVADVLTFSSVFFFWSLIYFLIHYISNYKKAEFENLKWQATINEIELNTLKSQLNPHFVFNSMNSIRALISEQPQNAKDAITKLSNILRNTMLMSKRKEIPLKDEITIVKDYLDMEKTRFEERLEYKINLPLDISDIYVPPLLIQTLVENGIKHGISNLTKGGFISVNIKRIKDKAEIKIINSGQINIQKFNKAEGLGLINSKQRLQILYQTEASLSIQNETDSTVITHIVIPIKNEKT